MDETKQKMPAGMIVILVLIGWGIVSLLLTLRNPVGQFGPMLLTGVGAIVMTLIIAAILVTIFVGIMKRFAWARKLAIGWYIISMVLALINLLSFVANNTMYDGYYSKTFAPGVAALMTPSMILMSLAMLLVFGWIIGIIIVIYLFRKRDFFTN
jgi:hypothetical protein